MAVTTRAHGQKSVAVPTPVHERLIALRDQFQVTRGRAVTIGEIIEWLLDVYAEDEHNA